METIRNIHIQTRGYSQENDYRWFRVQASDRKKPEFPDILTSFKDFNAQDIIDFQRPSIILYRSGKFHFLLVTALESEPNRLDYMNRRIRNSVVWTFKDSVHSLENEKVIREITILALRGELDDLVDKCIQNSEKEEDGFYVSFEKLSEIGQSFSFRNFVDSDANSKKMIGGDSKSIRDKLCDELSQSRLPRDNEGLLILTTTLKSKEYLQALPVWRGISSRFSTNDEWVVISDANQGDQTVAPQKKKTPLIALCILILLTLTLILGMYLRIIPPNLEKDLPGQEENAEQTQIFNPQRMEISMNQ
ncbi:hypothetical protein ACQ4N7_13795 [Nodosilinea sp. AN01ver1]|uniref:hypothetical protein n=1 Tax=Nodosilinea sp. AN01ver1 TaxID=3423362 RepID=UPI003D310E94